MQMQTDVDPSAQTQPPKQPDPDRKIWITRLERAVIRSGLRPRQKAVLQSMLLEADWEGWKLVSKQYRVARDANLSTATVSRAVRELAQMGLLEGERIYHGHRQLTTWFINVDAILKLRHRERPPMSAPPPESRSGPRTGQESPSAPRRSQPAHPQSPASSERYSQERYGQEPYSSESSLFERSRSDARLRPPFQNPDDAPPPERPADVPPWEPEAAPTRLHGPGIWFYIPPEALESQEVVDRLQRMLSAYCCSDKSAPTGRPETQSVSQRAGDSISRMGFRAGLSAPWKNGKDFTKISGVAEFQTEISETSETTGRRFQNEIHRIIPEIQILQAASANTSISSSSSETSAKNETPSPAETAPKSAEGLTARAPLRSAAQVGGAGDSSSSPAFGEEPMSGSPSLIEPTASDCDQPTSPSDVDASRPLNANETALLRSFMTTVRRYSGHEGMPVRWSLQPELEHWFLSTLRKEAEGKALGLDLNEVIVSWSGYLARRAAANQPFTTPSESFSLQLDYAKNLQRRKDAASTATPPPPPRPVRPPEGATACHEHGNFRFLAGQMYPIDVSFDEYAQLFAEVMGAAPDLSPERFREMALEDGLVPN